MPLAKRVKHSRVEWSTPERAMELLDARARRVLNMSGKEFADKWRAGEFRHLDSGDCPGVIELALLVQVIYHGRKEQRRIRR